MARQDANCAWLSLWWNLPIQVQILNLIQMVAFFWIYSRLPGAALSTIAFIRQLQVLHVNFVNLNNMSAQSLEGAYINKVSVNVLTS